MAKKQDDATVENQQALATIAGENGQEVNVADLLAQMKDAQVGHELTSEYWTLEVAEEERVVLIEMTEMNKMGGTNGEMTDAVRLLTSDGVLAICADKVIVSTARTLFNKGKKNIPVNIVCKNKKKGANGTYKEFEIKALLM